MARALALLAVLLVGAGSALAADGEPKKQIVAADQAKAKSIVARKADLGATWKIDADDSSSGGDDFRCSYYNPDQSDLTKTGDADSPDFVRETNSQFAFLASQASVFKTAGQMATSWSRVIRPNFARCFAEAVAEGIGEGGDAKFALRSAGTLAFPRLAPRTAAYRVTGTVTVEGQKVPVWFDVIAMSRGRSVALLLFAALLTAPDGQEERAIARAVATRQAAAFPS